MRKTPTDLPFTSMIFLSPFPKSETLPTTTFIRSPLTVPSCLRYRHISARAGESQARVTMSDHEPDKARRGRLRRPRRAAVHGRAARLHRPVLARADPGRAPRGPPPALPGERADVGTAGGQGGWQLPAAHV